MKHVKQIQLKELTHEQLINFITLYKGEEVTGYTERCYSETFRLVLKNGEAVTAKNIEYVTLAV